MNTAAMHWKRKWSKHRVRYELLQKGSEKRLVPKGYVPLLVGGENEEEERFVVHVSLFKNPSMSCLLDVAAQEIGYDQQGVLRIPCDVQQFQLIFNDISKCS